MLLGDVANTECYFLQQRYMVDDDDEQHQLFFNLLDHLLEYDPEKRLTAKEALEHPFIQAMLCKEGRHSHSKSR